MLFGLFGLAVFCALGGIGAFTAEMLMASTGIRLEAAAIRRAAAEGDAAEVPEPQPELGVSADSAGQADGA